MKILIISLPRTGSTTMLKTLGKKHDLKTIFEPFNSAFKKQYNHNMKNVVVKTIIGQVPTTENITSYVEWIVEFSKHFDEVILLSRKNLVACIESISYLMNTLFKKKSCMKKLYNSNSEYFYEKPPDDVYQKYETYIIDANEKINKISELLGIPIIYYEDIYDLNSNERLRKEGKPKLNKLI